MRSLEHAFTTHQFNSPSGNGPRHWKWLGQISGLGSSPDRSVPSFERTFGVGSISQSGNLAIAARQIHLNGYFRYFRWCHHVLNIMCSFISGFYNAFVWADFCRWGYWSAERLHSTCSLCWKSWLGPMESGMSACFYHQWLLHLSMVI